jgi:lipopolysaccharide export system protein LptA
MTSWIGSGRPLAALALGLGMVAAVALPPSGAALAQAPGTGLATSYAGNAGKPVDIEADSLEVDDKKKTAIFRGNVSATQGDVNLRSNEIQVTYVTGATKTANAEKPADAPPPMIGGGGDISLVEAKGNVVVNMTANKQRAQSDWAVFDVRKQVITLGGNVELSQGEKRENVIRGTKLIVDLNTGLSRIESTGRIISKFTPEEKEEKKGN